MGTFGYICAGCGTPINGDSLRGGEKCILIHVRHGKEIGRTEGHYDGYGRVIEDDTYRNDGEHPNSHKEICKSEYGLRDSFLRCQNMRVFNRKAVSFNTFSNDYLSGLIKKHKYCIENFEYKIYLSEELLADYRANYDIYRKLCKVGNERGAKSMAEQLCAKVTSEVHYNNSLRMALMRAYGKLPFVSTAYYSGTVAWHSVCYRNASEKQRKSLIPSDSDAGQANGRIRKKYK